MTIPDIITIDGPAGAGKSTLGDLLARRLGYLFFDTGAMYRALTWAALQHEVDLEDGSALAALARALRIEVQPPSAADGRQYTVLVDDQDVTWELRRPEVERNVSQASRYPAVREVMRERQRALGRRGRIVMVGRDIGNIVMPDAPLKIYLDASLEERARRRAAELRARGRSEPIADLASDMARRDVLDRHVMAPARDALVIASDGRSPEQIVELILDHCEQNLR